MSPETTNHPSTTPMATAGKIMRISVHTFLKHYQFFTSIAALLSLPFSLSLLLSQSLPLSLLPSSALSAASPSAFFSLLTLKLSQTLSSSLLTLPFSLSFLLFAKATAFQYLLLIKDATLFPYACALTKCQTNPSLQSLRKLYSALLSTHLCNSAIIFSVNAACFSLLFLSFSFLEAIRVPAPSTWGLVVSAIGAVVYSVALANATVVCTVALACAGMEGKGGFRALICAYSVLRNKISTALAMAVPINLGLATVEALFHFRIIWLADQRNDSSGEGEIWVLALEGVLIAYLYSIVLMLEVVASCFFYQSCKDDLQWRTNEEVEEGDEEDGFYYVDLEKLKALEESV